MKHPVRRCPRAQLQSAVEYRREWAECLGEKAAEQEEPNPAPAPPADWSHRRHLRRRQKRRTPRTVHWEQMATVAMLRNVPAEAAYAPRPRSAPASLARNGGIESRCRSCVERCSTWFGSVRREIELASVVRLRRSATPKKGHITTEGGQRSAPAPSRPRAIISFYATRGGARQPGGLPPMVWRCCLPAGGLALSAGGEDSACCCSLCRRIAIPVRHLLEPASSAGWCLVRRYRRTHRRWPR